MKKHNVKKITGIKVVTEIQGKTDRPTMPRPVTFDEKTKYNRNREKNRIRKEIYESQIIDGDAEERVAFIRWEDLR